MAPSRRRGWEIAHPLGEEFGEPRHVPLEDATVGENTHLHDDHLGELTPECPDAPGGGYKLTGVTDVANIVPIQKFVDRAWPDYNYPPADKVAFPLKAPFIINYRAFLAAQVKKGSVVEQFHPGSKSQFTLQHKAAAYPNLEVQNLIANGEVWTLDDYLRCRAISGVDDIMLGRGLVSRPDLARQIAAWREGRDVQPMPWHEVRVLLDDFWRQARRKLAPRYAPGRLKQWLGMLTRSYPEALELFAQIRRESDCELIDRLLQVEVEEAA